MSILRHWQDLPDEHAGTVTRKRLEGSGAALMRLEIKAGTVAARHTHPHEQFVQILSGSGTLDTAEGRQAFSAGSLFHFPAETWHAAEFNTDTVLVETNLAVPPHG